MNNNFKNSPNYYYSQSFKIENMQQEIKRLNESNAQLQKDINKLNEELKTKAIEIKTTNESNAQLQKDINKLNEELKTKAIQIKTTNESNAQLQKDINKLNEELKTKAIEIKTTNESNAQLQKDINKLNEELKTKAIEIKTTNESNAQLQKDINKLNEELKTKAIEIKTTNESNAQLQKDINKLNEELKTKAIEIKTTNESNAQLQKDINKLNEELKTKAIEIKTTNESNAQLQKDINKLNEELKTKAIEIKTTNESNAQLQKDINKLNEELQKKAIETKTNNQSNEQNIKKLNKELQKKALEIKTFNINQQTFLNQKIKVNTYIITKNQQQLNNFNIEKEKQLQWQLIQQLIQTNQDLKNNNFEITKKAKDQKNDFCKEKKTILIAFNRLKNERNQFKVQIMKQKNFNIKYIKIQQLIQQQQEQIERLNNALNIKEYKQKFGEFKQITLKLGDDIKTINKNLKTSSEDLVQKFSDNNKLYEYNQEQKDKIENQLKQMKEIKEKFQNQLLALLNNDSIYNNNIIQNNNYINQIITVNYPKLNKEQEKTKNQTNELNHIKQEYDNNDNNKNDFIQKLHIKVMEVNKLNEENANLKQEIIKLNDKETKLQQTIIEQEKDFQQKKSDLIQYLKMKEIEINSLNEEFKLQEKIIEQEKEQSNDFIQKLHIKVMEVNKLNEENANLKQEIIKLNEKETKLQQTIIEQEKDFQQKKSDLIQYLKIKDIEINQLNAELKQEVIKFDDKYKKMQQKIIEQEKEQNSNLIQKLHIKVMEVNQLNDKNTKLKQENTKQQNIQTHQNYLNLPCLSNFNIKNFKPNKGWEIQYSSEKIDINTPINLLITLIGNKSVGKNFIFHLLNPQLNLNKYQTENRFQQNYLQYQDSIIKAYFNQSTQNCFVSLTLNKLFPNDKRQQSESFWFSLLIAKSQCVIYVIDQWTKFEIEMIQKLTERTKAKTLIIIYNFKFKSNIEINSFITHTISQFFTLTQNASGFFISNTQIYHKFLFEQEPCETLNENNAKQALETQNIINKIVISQQKTSLFSKINDYFYNNSEDYFELDDDSERVGLQIQNNWITIEKQQNQFIAKTNILSNKDFVFKQKKKSNYLYVIKEEKKELKLGMYFYNETKELKDYKLDLSYDPAIVNIVLTNGQTEVIYLPEKFNVTEESRLQKYLNGFEIYFELIK